MADRLLILLPILAIVFFALAWFQINAWVGLGIVSIVIWVFEIWYITESQK